MVIRMEQNDLKMIMDVCGKSVAPKGNARQFLTSINLRIYEDGKIVATALDGFQMVQSYTECRIEEMWNDSKSYHDLMIDTIKVPKCLNVVITEKNDTVTFDFGSSSRIIQPAKKGDYIDYIRILHTVSHTEPALCIRFDPKIMSTVLASLAKDSKCVTMTFFDPVNGVVIDGDQSRGFVLPIRSYGSDNFKDIYSERFER